MDPATIILVARVVSELIGVGVEMAAAWQQGKTLIDLMIEEDRDPTEEEMNTLRAEIVARGDRIQNA